MTFYINSYAPSFAAAALLNDFTSLQKLKMIFFLDIDLAEHHGSLVSMAVFIRPNTKIVKRVYTGILIST